MRAVAETHSVASLQHIWTPQVGLSTHTHKKGCCCMWIIYNISILKLVFMNRQSTCLDVFLHLQTCQINWGSLKSVLWWSKWWATRTMCQGPSVEEVRKGHTCLLVCVYGREREKGNVLSTVVLFNGPYLSFDLSSGSKGEGHLPLSAQSVWQGQEPF